MYSYVKLCGSHVQYVRQWTNIDANLMGYDFTHIIVMKK